MSKMASFFAGLGSGYLKADRQRSEDERRAKLDARDQERHDAWADEQKQAKADKQGLRDAGAERTTITGTAVTDGGGNKNLYADPMQASAAAEDAKIEAEMRGQQPSMVKMQDATGITGNMAKGHQITTDPVDLKTINGAEAKAGRFQAELERQGKPLDALNMSNAVIDNKAKTLGLKTEELKFADAEFNRGVFTKLDANPDWTQGAAQLLTDTRVGRLAGLTVKPVVSADGKTVSFMGTGADGASQALATLPNTPDGRLQFTQQLMKATPETKISWLVESSKSAKSDTKDKQTQENWEKDYKLKETDANSKLALRAQQAENSFLRLQNAVGRGGSDGTSQARASDFNPYAGFNMEHANTAATKLVDESIANGKTPVSPQERASRISQQAFALRDSHAQQAQSRERVRVFRVEASQANTPEEIQAVQARAIQSGYTPQEMAQIDPRFSAGKPKTADEQRVAKEVEKLRASLANKGGEATAQNKATPSPMASTIEKMQADALNSFAPLAAKVKQADAAFIAVAKSGDQVAIARYLQEKQALRTQLEGAVSAKFGNAAPKVLQQLYAQ